MAGAGLNSMEGLWGEPAEGRLAAAILEYLGYFSRFSGVSFQVKLGTVLLQLSVNTGTSNLKVKPKTWEN